jgi:nucleoside-diphosphate-sugar epimerase
MAIVFKFLRHGIFPTFGKGNNSLPFIYVENLIDATLLVEEKGKVGEKYFVAEDPMTLREFAKAATDAFGTKLSGFYIPRWFALSNAFAKEMLEAALFIRCTPMHMDMRLSGAKIASSDWICSNEKIKSLGHKPAFTRDESMRRTVKWYKDNNLL